MAKNEALQRMRTYLYALLEEGDLREKPEVKEAIQMALESADPEWVPDVSNWVRIHRIGLHEENQPEEPLFQEPSPEHVRGDIFVGTTPQSSYPVWLPLKSFGQQGHVLFAGTTGTGKSTLLNFLSLQLMEHVPVTIYDAIDQAAPVLLPHAPTEKLGVIDYGDYRRNLFTGPPGMSQLDWIRRAANHLIDGLDIEPLTMNVLIQLCEEIVREGQFATIPRILEKLNQPGHRSSSYRALQNRLLTLMIAGPEVFSCERGFDLGEMFRRSLIFNLKGTNEQIRRLIYYDHHAYLTHSRSVLARWKLKNVFVFHEAASLVSRGAMGKSPLGEPFFLSMVREARNYGIGFVFADQVPHFEHTVIRSNIGTKGIFRLEDEAAVQVFKTSLGLGDPQKNAIMNLPGRSMVLRRPDIPFAFLVKVPQLY